MTQILCREELLWLTNKELAKLCDGKIYYDEHAIIYKEGFNTISIANKLVSINMGFTTGITYKFSTVTNILREYRYVCSDIIESDIVCEICGDPSESALFPRPIFRKNVFEMKCTLGCAYLEVINSNYKRYTMPHNLLNKK